MDSHKYPLAKTDIYKKGQTASHGYTCTHKNTLTYTDIYIQGRKQTNRAQHFNTHGHSMAHMNRDTHIQTYLYI
jgi:hypothetical protein